MTFAAEDQPTRDADTKNAWQRPAKFYEYYEPGDGRYYGVIMDKYNCSTEFIECELWLVEELEEVR